MKNISLNISKQLSNLVLDYTLNKNSLEEFYKYKPSIEGFSNKIENLNFNKEKRTILVNQLKEQYSKNNITPPKTIDLLLQNNTYTVTTGHQLCILGGPQFFIHKIVSTIKLTKQLKKTFPNKNFLPVFWLASEDHDFEEISKVNIYNKTLEAQTKLKGAVGRLPMSIFESLYEEIYKILGDRAKEISEVFSNNFNNKTLSQYTANWVTELFKNEDLIVLDGDNKELKKSFIDKTKQELINKNSYTHINNTSNKLKHLGYKTQVNPREINLFYLKDNLRERIIFENNEYKVLNTNISFSKENILEELKQNPQRFSPNVVFRPIYQESILPNIAYIGGPGEIAYWLQLKTNFEHTKTSFPILVLRDLFMPLDKKSIDFITANNLKLEDLFLNEDDLIKKFLRNNENTKLDFEEEFIELEKLKEKILEKSIKVDNSLKGLIESEFAKTTKGLNKIYNKTQKSIKQREEININKLKTIKQKLLPSGKLAERKNSFIPYYINNKNSYIKKLIETSDVFISKIKTIEM